RLRYSPALLSVKTRRTMGGWLAAPAPALLPDRIVTVDIQAARHFLNAGQGFLGPVPLLWRSRARFHGAASWTQTARSGRWQTGRATGAGIASLVSPFPDRVPYRACTYDDARSYARPAPG